MNIKKQARNTMNLGTKHGVQERKVLSNCSTLLDMCLDLCLGKYHHVSAEGTDEHLKRLTYIIIMWIPDTSDPDGLKYNVLLSVSVLFSLVFVCESVIIVSLKKNQKKISGISK